LSINAKKHSDRPTGRMADLVTEIEFAAVREEIDSTEEAMGVGKEEEGLE